MYLKVYFEITLYLQQSCKIIFNIIPFTQLSLFLNILHNHSTVVTVRKLTLVQYQQLLSAALIQIPPVFFLFSFCFYTGSASRSHSLFSCHVSLVSSNIWQFFYTFSFMILTFLMSTGQLFYRGSLSLYLFTVSHKQIGSSTTVHTTV